MENTIKDLVLNKDIETISVNDIISKLNTYGITINLTINKKKHKIYLPKHSDIQFKTPDFVVGTGQFSTVYKAYNVTDKNFLAYKVAESALEKIGRRQKIPRDIKDLRNEINILRTINPCNNQVGIQPSPYATVKIKKNKNNQEVCKVVSTKKCNCYLTTLCDGDLSPDKPGIVSTLVSSQSNIDKEDMISQLINGLRYLSLKGLMHGDIKPENIFKHGKKYYLADFGSSRIEEAFTDSNDVVPTLEFMTYDDMTSLVNLVASYKGIPGKNLDNLKLHAERCDVFALGSSICEILTGHLPYQLKKIPNLGSMANPKNTKFSTLYLIALKKNRDR